MTHHVPGAEVLAVVGGHDDEGIVEELLCFERFEYPTELLVLIGDFALIEQPGQCEFVIARRSCARDDFFGLSDRVLAAEQVCGVDSQRQ